MHISFWRRLIHQLGSLPFKSSLWLALCFSVCGGANLLEKPDPLLCTRLWLHKSAQSGQRQALVVLSGTHSESRRGRQALLLCLPDPGYMDTLQFPRSPWTDHKCSPPEWCWLKKSGTGNDSHPSVITFPPAIELSWKATSMGWFESWLSGWGLEHRNQSWNLFPGGGLVFPQDSGNFEPYKALLEKAPAMVC